MSRAPFSVLHSGVRADMHGVHARTTCAATANVSPVSCEADAAVGQGRDVLICADIGCISIKTLAA